MHKSRCVLSLVATVGLLAFALSGCNDDDDNGTGPGTTMTKAEQFELIDDYIDIDTTTQSELSVFMIGPLELGLGMIHGELFGGVSEDVLEDLDIIGLRKASPVNITSAALSFEYVNGWWEFEIDSSFTDEVGSKSVHYEGRVRFVAADGTPQMEPNDSTVRFIEEGSVDATVTVNSTAGTTVLNWVNMSEVTVDMDTLGGAILNSTTDGTLSAELDGLSASYSFVLAVDGQTSDLTFPSLEESCPTDGSVQAVLDLTYHATGTSPASHAEAEWTITGNVEENGEIDATIQSGDFARTMTIDLECDPGESP